MKEISDRLSGLVELGAYARDTLAETCRTLRGLGFVDAYLGDAFLEMKPADQYYDPELLVFTEPGARLLLRSREQLAEVRDVIHQHGLSVQSAHYNQVLPPPGCHPAAWLDRYHHAMIERAALLGLKRVTTHPGWMFGSAMEQYTGEAARDFARKKINLTELNHRAHLAYGGDDSVWRDSVEIYRGLCGLAAAHGITVTLETAISEWYGLTLHPGRMREFIQAVGAPNLGICVDSGHCHLNGLDVPDVIRACGGLMVETHFHDNHGERDEHLPIGEGTINWNTVLQALRDIQYSGLITFEQRNHALNAERWRALAASP